MASFSFYLMHPSQCVSYAFLIGRHPDKQSQTRCSKKAPNPLRGAITLCTGVSIFDLKRKQVSTCMSMVVQDVQHLVFFHTERKKLPHFLLHDTKLFWLIRMKHECARTICSTETNPHNHLLSLTFNPCSCSHARQLHILSSAVKMATLSIGEIYFKAVLVMNVLYENKRTQEDII